MVEIEARRGRRSGVESPIAAKGGGVLDDGVVVVVAGARRAARSTVAAGPCLVGCEQIVV